MRRISRAWTRVAKVAMRKINIAGDHDEEWDTWRWRRGGIAIGPFRTAFELSPHPTALSQACQAPGAFLPSPCLYRCRMRETPRYPPPSISLSIHGVRTYNRVHFVPVAHDSMISENDESLTGSLKSMIGLQFERDGCTCKRVRLIILWMAFSS